MKIFFVSAIFSFVAKIFTKFLVKKEKKDDDDYYYDDDDDD